MFHGGPGTIQILFTSNEIMNQKKKTEKKPVITTTSFVSSRVVCVFEVTVTVIQ
jgi:hypothetical protein